MAQLAGGGWSRTGRTFVIRLAVLRDLQINADEAAVVVKIYELYSQGCGYRPELSCRP